MSTVISDRLINTNASSLHPRLSRPSNYAQKPALKASTVSDSSAVGEFNPGADKHHHYEFGGPWGTLGLMILFPCMMYYFFICLWCFDGKLSRPASMHPSDVIGWASEFWGLVKLHTCPTWRATTLYTSFMAYQLLLAWVMPGVPAKGMPIPSLNGAKLDYHCNALASWYLTLATVFVLHSMVGIVRLGDVFDQLGHLMTVATAFGFAVSLFYYVQPILKGQTVRMSGNMVYDFFMGASLSPRIGHIDVKLFAEVRIPWVLLFIISVSGAVKQYETIGYLTPNAAFMVLAIGSYTNACAKGEECIPLTWDMNYEKWGWLLCFWNLAGVSFTYCHSVIFIATQPPERYALSPIAVYTLYVTYLVAYYFFDTSNSQKARFKMDHNTGMGMGASRVHAFPQLPYGRVKAPKMLVSEDGQRKLLVDGTWAWCRKPNYTADFVQALCWAASAGTSSFIPYFYPTFFLLMIVHRCERDFARCAKNYGKLWEEYCILVPYKFIPGVY